MLRRKMSINGETDGELRENVPLKSGTKKSSWIRYVFCKEDCLGGSKIVTVSFAVLTIAITISLIIQIYYGDYQIVPHGSVATDSQECSNIGVDVLKQGGNAVDAAIASALCLAVVNPHNTGLDAGGVFMIYSHRTRTLPEVIDFSNEIGSVIDDVPIPRLVLGLIYAHLKFGKLPWRNLVKPAANLASQGFKVDNTLAQAVTQSRVDNEQIENLFKNLEAGKMFNLLPLGSTLQQIADIPEDDLMENLSPKTEPSKTTAMKSTFDNYNIYVPDLPTSGPMLLVNLQHIELANFTKDDVSTPKYVNRLAELLQKLYIELNITKRYHQGTSSNVAAIDMDDLYVSLVTGMHSLFGSHEMTTWGYILDVKDPTVNANTRIPIIITDKNYICGRRIVMGSGDLSVATQVITSLLLAGENATSSVEGPRFKIINSTVTGIEDSHIPKFNDAIPLKLRSLGDVQILPEPYSSCNVVEKTRDDLSSHSDSRGGGISYRF